MVAVIAVFGPTASGKTAVAEEVADRLGTEVVSCDAMQVYRGLPILTNQPSRPTALVGIRDLDEEMSVGAYATLAHAAIDELVDADAGLRSSAAARGSTSAPRSPTWTCRRRPARACGSGSWPRSSAIRRRRTRGSPPRSARSRGRARERPAAPRPRARARRGRRVARARRRPALGEHDPAPDVIVGLEVPPDELERRIVARTEAMFEQGVVAEVQAALATGVSRTAAQDARARRDRNAVRGGGAGAHRHPHPPLRRLPAEVDAPDPRDRPGRRHPSRGRDRRRRARGRGDAG